MNLDSLLDAEMWAVVFIPVLLEIAMIVISVVKIIKTKEWKPYSSIILACACGAIGSTLLIINDSSFYGLSFLIGIICLVVLIKKLSPPQNLHNKPTPEEMKDKAIALIWKTGWILFALTHTLLPLGYFSTNDSYYRGLYAVMTFYWYGAMPLFFLTLVSPIMTARWSNKLSPDFRIKGYWLPLFLLLGYFITGVAASLILAFIT